MKRLAGLAALGALAACDPGAGPPRVVGELASDRVELTAEFDEPIVALTVDEGQAVTEGEPLVVQDDRRARARLAALEAGVGQARARLDELLRGPREERIRAARASLGGAEQEAQFRADDYARIRDVYARDLASTEALDRAEAALDAARAELDRRRAELEELLAGTTVEELAQAEETLKLAQARREEALLDVERHRLAAPVDGILDSRLFEVGERPPAGRPVLVLLAGRQPYARVYVPESLRVNVAPGQAAVVHVDGLPEPLEGRVRWVSADAAFTPYFALTERDRGRLSYLAKIDLPDLPRRLPDGVPVEVEFPGLRRAE